MYTSTCGSSSAGKCDRNWAKYFGSSLVVPGVPCSIVGQVHRLSPYSLERPASVSESLPHASVMPFDCSLVTMAADVTAWSSSPVAITAGSPSSSPITSRHLGKRPSTNRPVTMHPSMVNRTSFELASTWTEPSPLAMLETAAMTLAGTIVFDSFIAWSVSVSTHASRRPSVATQFCIEPSSVGVTSSNTPPKA